MARILLSNKNAQNAHLELPDVKAITTEQIEAKWQTPASGSRRLDATTFSNTAATLSINPIEVRVGNYSVTNSVDSAVKCLLCPKHCIIKEGRTGLCSARINRGGRLYARFYGRPTALAIEPIEKKPLFHFLPGSSILSLGTRGCNLSCSFCQNWQLSQPLPYGTSIQNALEPKKVVELALQNNCPSVAFTYNEPTIWAEYVIDVAKLCKSNGIKTALVTNGIICEEARRELYAIVDAANVDLKGFSQEFYHDLTGGELNVVKATLTHIARETSAWLEITNLIIPGHNDSLEEIGNMSRWIANELGNEIPLHFSAFFPTHHLTTAPPTPPSKLFEAVEVAKSAGLVYVYCGNINDAESQSTHCPQCGTPLIRRRGYKTSIMSTFSSERNEDQTVASSSQIIREGRCQVCGKQIAGVFQQ